MSGLTRRLQQGSVAYVGVTGITHGQQMSTANTGRAGAAAAAVANYSFALTTVSGDQTYSTTQTIRNKQFTGKVLVTGGNVTFEFCLFTSHPATASAQLQQYNGGDNSGTVTCNWCDFDTGLTGAQGNFETCCAQFGERGSANPLTNGSSFTLYRCHLTGCGNIVGIHQYRSSGSAITECLLQWPTNGAGTHPDGIELYSSDNVTVLRSRIELTTGTDQSCLNITTDFGDCTTGNPVIIQDNYINGGNSPVLTRWYNQGDGTYIKNVRYQGNYFGDSSVYGRECDFNSMDVTYDESYALVNPTVIYWAEDNVWTPNGEGVTDPATAPSGDIPAGQPHTPGSFVDARNFYGGEVWVWSGNVVGPGSETSPPAAPTIGMASQLDDTHATVSWTDGDPGDSSITGYTITPYISGVAQTASTYDISETTLAGSIRSVSKSGTTGTTYTFTVAATNSYGTGPASAQSNAVTLTSTDSGEVVNAWDDPSAAGWPDATNTGWQPTGVTLTPHAGDYTVSTAGATIDSLDISGQLIIAANNVTIKRCRVTVSSINDAAVKNTGGYTGVIIQDCEVIGGSGTHGSYNGIQTGDATIERCNVHHFENPIEAESNLTLQDCYLHDLYADYPGAVPHYDGVECGSGSNFTIHHNTVDLNQAYTGAINFSGDFGSISDVTITDNLLRGGTYVVYLDIKGNGITGVTLDNNRFGRTQQYGTLYDNGASYTHAPAGNVYDDDNSAAI